MKKSKIINLSIISVLLYIIFLQEYNIFEELLFWSYIKTSNDIFLYVFLSIIVIISLFFLDKMYNYFVLNSKINQNKIIIGLITASVFLILLRLFFKNVVAEYIISEEELLKKSNILVYYGKVKFFDNILPFVTLIYFLWKRNI